MKIKIIPICLISLLLLGGFFNLNIYAQELNDTLPIGIETYLINDFSDYKKYELEYIKNLPKYNSESLTEFHMPIVYRIPSSEKMDINNFIKQGMFLNSNKNFTDRLLDSGYTIYGDFGYNKYFMVDYWIKVKASDKPFSVDFIPKIELNNKDYDLKQYAWWNSSYLNYKILTIDHSYIDTDLVNFTVLVKSTNTTMLGKMDNGTSLRFLNLDNTTEYKYEIERFDDTIEMVVWVKIPRIENDTNTKFIMYYNNSGATDNQDAPNTWDSNFLAVWHMNGSAYGDIFDSTGNGNVGIGQSVSSPTYQQSGKTGYAVDFEFTNSQYIDVTHNIFGSNNYGTVEVWGKSESTGNFAMFGCYIDSSHRQMIYLTSGYLTNYYRNSADTSKYCKLQSSSLNTVSLWNYNVVTQNTSIVSTNNPRLYENGKQPTQTYQGTVPPTEPEGWFDDFANEFYYIGWCGVTEYMDGLIDEIRLSKICRNHTWINSTYLSIKQSDFITFGDEVESGWQCPDITYSGITPTHGTTTVSHLITNLSVTINVSDGTNFNYSIECSNGNTTSANNVSNGTYNLSVCCLIPETLYYWYVNSSVNATCGWTNTTYNFTTKSSGCDCVDELTAILNELKKINANLEGDNVIAIDTIQFVIVVQLFLLCVFLYMGCSIPAMEGNKKSLHYMPFSGGLFLMFGGLDFISFSVLLTYNYSFGLIGGFLIIAGVILLLYGVLKAFYYE